MTVFIFVRHGEPDWNLCEEKKLVGARRDLVPLPLRGVFFHQTSRKTGRQGKKFRTEYGQFYKSTSIMIE